MVRRVSRGAAGSDEGVRQSYESIAMWRLSGIKQLRDGASTNTANARRRFGTRESHCTEDRMTRVTFAFR